MEIGDNEKDGTRGEFVEKGEIGAIVQNWLDPHSHLYGLPLAVGGMGNNDYHGDTILIFTVILPTATLATCMLHWPDHRYPRGV
ncbi:hypothetical protein HDC93_007413 [Streptomyces sp. AK010]|nr:hypothetical protein [Streptomyces sp. AK010]